MRLDLVNPAFLIATAVVCGACTQADPPPLDSTTSPADSAAEADPGSSGKGGAESGGPSGGDYYPLVDGATFIYRHTAADGVTWTEEVQMTAISYRGAPAFELRDSEDAQGEVTASILASDGSAVMRVHKEILVSGVVVETVDYTPGFLRFDRSWTSLGDGASWTYVREQYDGAGQLVTTEDRIQQFTVEELASPVTVAAGTFNATVVLRQRPDNGDEDRFWFAPGLGKIKRQDLSSASVEELSEFWLP